MSVKGYKVFDENWKCRDMQYEVGKTYEINEKPILCERGFHFCLNIVDCFKYYTNNLTNKIAEVEALGDITEQESDCTKLATNKIIILREITKEKSYQIGNQGQLNTGNRNTGNSNTGYSNTGNSNTGDSNTGNSNTGDSNTGNWNTGNWNTCGYETGFLNTVQNEYIRIFNKKYKKTEWDKINKPCFFYFDLTEWISLNQMTVKEKNANPSYKTAEGYLKKYEYKDAFIKSFNNTNKQDVELLLQLPNFDYKIFEEISGISKKMIREKLKGE